MKILWCTHSLAGFKPEVGGYNGSGWITALLNKIKLIPDIEIGIAFYHNKREEKIEHNNIVYFPIYNGHINIIGKIKTFFNNYSAWTETESSHLHDLLDIIHDYKPDLIHVWGTETDMGLIADKVEIPVILHLQGLLNPYNNALCPPGVSRLTYISRNGYNPIRLLKNRNDLKYWKYKSDREIRIFKSCKYYLGRTHWDKDICRLFSPQSTYYYCSEMLRSEFYLNENNTKMSDGIFRIVSTISPPLYKGSDIILKTAKILLEFSNINFEWNVIGVNDMRKSERLTGILSKDVNVKCLGVKSALEIKNIELNSNLYFHSSYIDNSPNSVCEAQMLGLPVVAVNSGGLSSIIENQKTGFLIPSNEPHIAASTIIHLANNESIAKKISLNGMLIAKKRHDPKKIIQSLVSIYKILSEK